MAVMQKTTGILLGLVLCVATLCGATYLAGECDKNPLSYRVNEEMVFRINLLKDGKTLPGKKLQYYIDTDDGKKERGAAPSGETLVLKTSLSKPGFARIRVYPFEPDGNKLEGIREYDGGAGAAVEKIVAAEPAPKNFDSFWNTYLEKLKATPTEAKLAVMESNVKGMKLFEFELPTLPGMPPATGFVAYPEKAAPKSVPAQLEFEGYNSPAPASRPGAQGRNRIVIRVNRHGLPNRREKEFYEQQKADFQNFGFRNNDKPETSDFLGMFLRALRVAEFAKTLPAFNGKLAVSGGSMGAFQAIAVAALDTEVTDCSISIPWSCDLAGIRHGRMRGWRPDPEAGVLYFDPVYFARNIRCPVTVRAGLGDYVSPPSGVMAFYNALTGPAQITFVQNMKHGSGEHPGAGTFTLRKNQPAFSDQERQLQKVTGLPDPRLLDWVASDSFCSTEKRNGKTLFIVDVPPGNEAGSHGFSARLDPTPFRGKSICFLVRFRTSAVSKPPQRYLGSKFMLVCNEGTGSKPQYHDAWLPEGDNDWTTGSIYQSITPGTKNAELLLGLQDVSGRIEFELDSLECGAVYTPENRTNQDYKIRYPDSVRNARLRGVMSPGGPMTEEMLQTLNQWNVNLVRYQFIRNWGQMGTEMDLDEYNAWLDRRLANLEEMAALAPKYGIRFIVDMHSPPGGKSGWYNMRMFAEKKYADAFVDCWKKIAERFKSNPAIFAYDLINEPFQGLPSKEGYWDLQYRAAREIRKIDPETSIVVTSNEGGGIAGFSYLSPLPMDNIIYQVHFYDPLEFTHQRSKIDIRYPGIINGVKWNRETMRQKLQPIREFQLKHDAIIYVGEFSANVWAPGAEWWIADCIGIFEEYGWLWSFHAFREWAGWSVEHDGTGPDDLKEAGDTKRKKALLDGLKRNIQNAKEQTK